MYYLFITSLFYSLSSFASVPANAVEKPADAIQSQIKAIKSIMGSETALEKPLKVSHFLLFDGYTFPQIIKHKLQEARAANNKKFEELLTNLRAALIKSSRQKDIALKNILIATQLPGELASLIHQYDGPTYYEQLENMRTPSERERQRGEGIPQLGGIEIIR
jgi:hypothetical protein